MARKRRKQLARMPPVTDRPRILLDHRRERLIEELPKHGWDYTKAGIAAGYSPAYAHDHLKRRVTRDVVFCRRVNQLYAEIEAKTTDRRENIARMLYGIAMDEQERTPNRVRAAEALARQSAWVSETLIHETGPRLRELTEAQRVEAAFLATARFALPPGVPSVVDAIITAQSQTKESVNVQSTSDDLIETPEMPVSDGFTPPLAPPESEPAPDQPGPEEAPPSPPEPAPDAPFP